MAEGAAVPLEGWDFSWFDGRATEERPPWGYARLMGERMAVAHAALDVETGGGEVLATVARPRPPRFSSPRSPGPPTSRSPATGCVPWAPRSSRWPTRRRCPSSSSTFDLVVSRHPVVVLWDEIARVLEPERDLPLPADRRRHQPRADRLHDGPAAGQREPQSRTHPCRGRGGGARGGRPAVVRAAGSSSSTSAPSSTSSARCTGRCRVSRPRPTPTGSGALHEQHRARRRVRVAPRERLLVEARRPA